MCLQMDCRWAAIAQRGENGNSATLLAFWDGAAAAEPFAFQLAGTPCEQIYAGTGADNHFFVSDGVQDRFPEFELLRRIGAQCYRGHVFFDAEGRAAGHVLIMDDKPASDDPDAVTFFQLVSQRVGAEYNRWLAEESLRDNQRRLTDFAESISDSLWETDENHRFTFVSQYLMPPEYRDREPLGKTRWELVGGDPDGDRNWVQHRQALDNREPFRDFEYAVPSEQLGGKRYFSVSGHPVFDPDGTFRGYRGATNDITDKQLMLEALCRSEERYHHVFDFANDSIFIIDPDTHRFLEVNESAAQRLGYSRDQLTQMTVRDIHPEDDLTHIHDAFGEIMSHGASMFETIHTRKDGTKIPVEISARTVKLDGREVSLAFGRDISERKAAEEKLRQAQKMEAVGQLTGGIAHDFNNLLAVIVGNLELAEERLESDPNVLGMVDSALRAAEKGAELISRLLAFSRKQALSPRTLSAGAIVTGMHDMLRRILPETIDISVATEDAGAISVDPRMLESALLNLVVNARDAMPGGGTLTIETADVELDYTVTQDQREIPAGPYVRIAVSDDGEGIDAGILERVFEPFFTTKEVGQGSGMGLSMVLGFVRQSSGHVHIYSEPGQGTTIKLYFPRTDSEQVHASVDDSHAIAKGQGEHILVVEDDDDVRAMAVTMLQRLGYAVTSATTGPEALAVMKDLDQLDLLLSDVVLAGGMDGPSVADIAREKYDGLRVLFMSGYAHTAIKDRKRTEDDYVLLPKPFRKTDLAKAVRDIIDA